MTIVVEKGGGRFWEGSTYSFLEKRGYILGGGGVDTGSGFWGVYSGREG